MSVASFIDNLQKQYNPVREMGTITIDKVMNSIETQDSQYKFTLTSLTALEREFLSEAKFYEVRPSDFVSVIPGKFAYQDDIVSFATAPIVGDPEGGVITTGEGEKMQEAKVIIKQVPMRTFMWSMKQTYSIIDLYKAMQAMSFDLVEATSKARAKVWQIGIVQKVMFQGSKVFPNVKGLLNSDLVDINLTHIPKPIANMTSAEFMKLATNVMNAYNVNNGYSELKPDIFVIPYKDWTALCQYTSTDFNLKTKMELLLEAFKMVTDNPNFKIKPLVYANKDKMTEIGIPKYRYMLYKNDKETLRAYIPINLTNTAFGTQDNFNFQNVAYGQLSGVQFFRPKEALYFDHAVDPVL